MWTDILTWFGLVVALILLYFLYDYIMRKSHQKVENGNSGDQPGA